jgi:hypothetical protein
MDPAARLLSVVIEIEEEVLGRVWSEEVGSSERGVVSRVGLLWVVGVGGDELVGGPIQVFFFMKPYFFKRFVVVVDLGSLLKIHLHQIIMRH